MKRMFESDFFKHGHPPEVKRMFESDFFKNGHAPEVKRMFEASIFNKKIKPDFTSVPKVFIPRPTTFQNPQNLSQSSATKNPLLILLGKNIEKFEDASQKELKKILKNKRKTNKKRYVYMWIDSSDPKYIKIGSANNVEQRIKACRTFVPKVQEYKKWCFENQLEAFHAEFKCHKELSKTENVHRIANSECFYGDVVHVADIVENIIQNTPSHKHN
jgi:hypothetical protein